MMIAAFEPLGYDACFLLQNALPAKRTARNGRSALGGRQGWNSREDKSLSAEALHSASGQCRGK